MSRLRATVLLRSGIVVAELVALAGVMVALYLAGQLGVAIALLFLWSLVEAFGLPSGAIEAAVVRRVERRGVRGPSLWFVDLDVEQRARDVSYAGDTRDNPTLR